MAARHCSTRAIEAGFVQREIEDSSYRKQLEVECEERHIVGVNLHTDEEVPDAEILKISDEVRDRQIAKLQKLRADRDSQKYDKAMSELRSASQNGENLMPFIVEAVKCHATVGEICDLFRQEYGQYQEPGL